jgi:hypothetical protein
MVINEFKKICLTRNNLLQDEKCDQLADTKCILSRWVTFQLLTLPGINAVWHTEVLTAELLVLLVLEYGAYQIETDIAKLNTCTSPSAQIQAEVIQSGGKVMHSKIHKFINSVWIKK